jgi:serine/threonine protein kinase
MAVRGCPTHEELAAFSAGKLSDDAADTIAQHLDRCSDCQATIESLVQAGGSLVQKLREHIDSSPFQNEVEGRQAISAAKLAPALIAAESVTAPITDSTLAGKLRFTAPTLEQFQQQLVERGFLAAEDLKSLTASLAADKQPTDAQSLARLLAEQGKLTKFQAGQLCFGNGQWLICGEYVVLEPVGAGGMGLVFKARHRRMERIVALKMLHASALRSSSAVRRFQREVRAAARLEHPNIITAHDAGEANGVHFLVMQFVEGEDLNSLVKRNGPLPVGQAVDYVMQTARGLAYAHSKGVVHRDIKPANLMVDRSGTVKILDMGLARFDDATKALAAVRDGLTQSGQVMGTVDYMAPEQAYDTRLADARADIYSLGCTLYRMLTGEPIYPGETLVQKILAHREHPVPSLRSRICGISSEFDGVFQRMVAKAPEQRFQTMADVLDAISGCSPVPSAEDTSSDIDSGKVTITIDTSDAWINARLPLKPSAAPRAHYRLPFGRQTRRHTVIVALLALSGIATGWMYYKTIGSKSAKEEGAILTASPTNPVDPLVAAVPFSRQQARAYQERWAELRRTEVETTNSLGMEFR